MNQADQFSTDQFTALGSAPFDASAVRIAGNILKNKEYRPARFSELSDDSKRSDGPSVVVHRNGDVIERIEFICTCGCTKSVLFETDGE
jgi:hypothetical protein